MRDIKLISPREFTEKGYMQEVNRRVLHPLGLAIAVVDIGPNWRFDGVWDCRDDPEGLHFGEGVMSPEKYLNVEAEWEVRAAARLKALGYVVQPPPSGALRGGSLDVAALPPKGG